MKKTLLLCGALLLWLSTTAQDLHFSQFYHTPLNVNPALTGVFPEDVRFSAIVRNQWGAVPVPYTTFGAAFDQKIWNDGRLGKNTLGGGLLFNYDRSGAAQFQTLQIGGALAYTLQFSRLHSVSGGLRLLAVQRRFDAARLTFDRQFIDGTFLPLADNGEDFRNFTNFYADVGAGINWRFQVSKRMRFHFGAAAMHLNRPPVAFADNDEKRQPLRWNVHIDGVIQFSERLDFMPSALFSRQGTEQERVFGTAFRYHLDRRFAREKALTFGAAYRLNDALIAAFGMTFPTAQVTISYDLTTSEFSAANQHAGGVELSVQHVITKVKPMNDHKTCPIF